MIDTSFDAVCNLVNELNEEIMEHFGDDFEFELYQGEAKTNGLEVHILFFDQVIWDSDNDERMYNEKEDEFESLDTFVRRKLNEVVQNISKLKF